MVKETTTITIKQKELVQYKKFQKKANQFFQDRYQIKEAFTLGEFFGLLMMYMEHHVEDLVESITIPDLSIEHDPSFVWNKSKKKVK